METYEYTLQLQLKGAPGSYCSYNIELTENEEDNPDQLKQKIDQEHPLIFDKFKQDLNQLKPPRRITGHILKQVLETWMENILEGQFATFIERDLPIFEKEDLENITEDGPEHELPEFLFPDRQDINIKLALAFPLNL
jgi:hypothetical protein